MAHSSLIMAAAIALASSLNAPLAAGPIPADEWALAYRNWTYYDDWVIPPSCIDTSTCSPPYINKTGAFTDIFQLWSLPTSDMASTPYRYIGVYTFFDGVGYQTAWAGSNDMLHFNQSLSPGGILYSSRTAAPRPQPGDFDYGGAAFVGPLLTDYNVTSPRVLARVQPSNRFWYAYFGQPTRNAMEPPPGASGLASSSDGFTWTRETLTPFLDTNASHGAQEWEREQIYAPYLILDADGAVTDVYNARVAPNTPWHEQSGLAMLPGGAAALPGVDNVLNVSYWTRYAGNPVVPNGNSTSMDFTCASDPKVYWDQSLDGGVGAWVMFYFGYNTATPGANICIAFSRDRLAWTKASSPIYEHGGHPKGMDKCEAHKVWLTVDDTGRKMLYYTGDDCKGRGILVLTSTPL